MPAKRRRKKDKRTSAAVNSGEWNRRRIKLICLMHDTSERERERERRRDSVRGPAWCYCWKWPACIKFVHSSMMKMWALYCNDDFTLSFDALASSILCHFTLYTHSHLFCFCRCQCIMYMPCTRTYTQCTQRTYHNIENTIRSTSSTEYTIPIKLYKIT